MNVTIEEFKTLIEISRYYCTPDADKYNDSITKHLFKQSEEDLKFRAFIKHHYPEALESWVALQNIKES